MTHHFVEARVRRFKGDKKGDGQIIYGPRIHQHSSFARKIAEIEPGEVESTHPPSKTMVEHRFPLPSIPLALLINPYFTALAGSRILTWCSASGDGRLELFPLLKVVKHPDTSSVWSVNRNLSHVRSEGRRDASLCIL